MKRFERSSVQLCCAAWMGALCALSCAGEANLVSPDGTTSAPLAGSLSLYNDAPVEPFCDRSWTMHNMTAASPVHGGSASIQMDPGAYGGIKLHSPKAFAAADYAAIDFWVHGGSAGGQSLRVFLTFSDDKASGKVLAEKYTGGKIAANRWSHVVIPLADLAVPAGAQFTDLTIMGNTSGAAPAVYIDDIVLTPGGVPPVSVYDEGLANGFTDGSWGGGVNMKATSPVHAGKTAIAFTPNNYNGVQFMHAAIDGYNAVRFWVHGGAAGSQRLWVGVTGTPKGTYRAPVDNYGGVKANGWVQITVPFSDMGAPNVSFSSVYIMDQSGAAQPTVTIDDVQLVAMGKSSPVPTPGPTTGPGAAGWLYTKGNRIYTSKGALWHGRGANIQDPRGCGACGGANLSSSTDEVIRRIDMLVDQWHANFLRLTLESTGTSSVLTDSAYLAAIQRIVNHVGTKPGVVMELSVWIDPSINSQGWPTANTVKVWQKLTDTFHAVPYLIFGIINEPQSNYDHKLDADVWDAMNTVASAIRATEALYGSNKHLIAAQGTGGWARFLQYYMTHPLTAGGGSNFVYEVHVYDGVSTFNDRFIAPSKVIPVIIGEYGPVSGAMSNSDCSALMSQAEAAEVPYLAWTFHMRCPPNLINDNSGGGCGMGMNLTPSTWGTLVKDRLAKPW